MHFNARPAFAHLAQAYLVLFLEVRLYTICFEAENRGISKSFLSTAHGNNA